MLEIKLLSNLLNHNFYKNNKLYVDESLFSDDTKDIYRIIKKAHTNYNKTITAQDVMAMHEIVYPVATQSQKDVATNLITKIEQTPKLTTEVAIDVLKQLKQRERGRQIANLGIAVSEGNADKWDEIIQISNVARNSEIDDEFGEPCTDDLEELLYETSNENRYKFNLRTLSKYVYGIGRGEFGIIFATSETGKTAFAVSLCVSPDGFCQQGAKVLYIGNEEKSKRTKLRAYQAFTGMNRDQIIKESFKAVSDYSKIKSNMIMKDTQDWSLMKLESYVDYIKPDIIILDQADKVQLEGKYNASHEKLAELYRRLRELAKKSNCAVLALSQASAEAEDKTRLSYTLMAGSKMGKAGEADIILGIGRHSGETEDGIPDNTRFITVSKNKLSGFHGTVICQIQPELSRYVE
tara:strand:+ start:1502 stop:2725 length:1224 start_codon:yes stop_codon:yes gene_type:complete